MNRLSLWLSTILSVSVLLGCGSAGYTTGGGGGTPSVNISSGKNRTIVDANGTATLTATVQQLGGTPTYSWQLLDPGTPCAPQCGTLNSTSTASVVYTAPSTLPSGTTQLSVTTQVTVTSSGTTVTGSFTLTVTPAISVTITNKVNPATVQAASSAVTFNASVTNDENSAGVSWSLTTGGAACTAACGTLTNATTTSVTYTPPSDALSAGGPAVTVVATSVASTQDPTSASDSDTFTITPAAIVVSFAPNPPFSTVLVGGSTQTITVTVTHDITAGGVSRSLQAGTPLSPCPITSPPATLCGAIAAYQQTTTNNTTTATFTYTPPSGSMVPAAPYNNPTIVATANGGTHPAASFSFAINLGPVAISFTTAPPATIAVNAMANIAAHVTNDPANKGVDWSLGCAVGTNCGTITPHTASDAPAAYTAPPTVPGGGGLTITATSTADPSKSISGNVIIQLPANNAALNGQYAFEFNGFDTNSVPIVIAGYFTADGNGNITGGLEDFNQGTLAHQSNVAIQAAPASTYNIQTNGRGSLTLATASGTSHYDLILDSHGNGRFIELDTTEGSGTFEKQDATAFATSSLNGSFAIGMIGNSPLQGRGVFEGAFQADGTNKISNGQFDTADITGSGPAGTFSGGFAVDTTTGHGTMTFNITGGATLNFALDIVSASKVYVVETDAVNNSIKAGVIRKQTVPSGGFTTASLTGNSVFDVAGIHQATGNPIVVAGVLNVTTAGMASGVLDGNAEGTVTTNSSFSNVPYTVATNGRGTVNVTVGTITIPAVFYLFGQNQGFVIEGPSTTYPYAVAGEILSQTGAPFAVGTPLATTSGFSTETPASTFAEEDVGLVVLSNTGQFLMQTVDSTFNPPSSVQGQSFTGTYTLAASGRGAVSITTPSALSLAFYVVSPGEYVVIATVGNGDTLPVLFHASQ
jgi:hypothetical protein